MTVCVVSHTDYSAGSAYPASTIVGVWPTEESARHYFQEHLHLSWYTFEMFEVYH